MSDPQKSAQKAFNELSFFILTGLGKGADVGVDGKLWQVNQFSGFKLLPPGLHLFVYSASPSSHSAPDTISSGIGVRHGLLKFFGKGETIVESWDNVEEELEGPRRKRRRTTAGEKGKEVEGTVVSEEYLKGLDQELAPYPDGLGTEWKELTRWITEETLARVVGVDERGVGAVSAVMGSTGDEEELKEAGRKVWGKERSVEEEEEGEKKDGAEEEEEELLRFVTVDVKRSWPKGATGAELSRWSMDKSWVLSNAVREQLGGDFVQLLAEFQLSFVLFTLLHNFSSLTTYKSLFTLLCRSSSLLFPPSSLPPSPHNSTLLTPTLPIYASFLSSFASQLHFLDTDFFSVQMPSLESSLLDDLAFLRTNLSEAAPHWLALASDPKTAPAVKVWEEVVRRWDGVASVGMEKFGWEVGMVGSRTEGKARVLREDDEIDLEDLEEGEDAPVIVEM